MDFLLEAYAEEIHVGILAGIGLHEQDLEYRLVGGIHGLVELPQGGAEEFPGGQFRHAAEVQHVVGAHEAPRQEFAHIGVVLFLVFRRHQPPDRKAAAHQQAGAVELVEQQGVL